METPTKYAALSASFILTTLSSQTALGFYTQQTIDQQTVDHGSTVTTNITKSTHAYCPRTTCPPPVQMQSYQPANVQPAVRPAPRPAVRPTPPRRPAQAQRRPVKSCTQSYNELMQKAKRLEQMAHQQAKRGQHAAAAKLKRTANQLRGHAKRLRCGVAKRPMPQKRVHAHTGRKSCTQSYNELMQKAKRLEQMAHQQARRGQHAAAAKLKRTANQLRGHAKRLRCGVAKRPAPRPAVRPAPAPRPTHHVPAWKPKTPVRHQHHVIAPKPAPVTHAPVTTITTAPQATYGSQQTADQQTVQHQPTVTVASTAQPHVQYVPVPVPASGDYVRRGGAHHHGYQHGRTVTRPSINVNYVRHTRPARIHHHAPVRQLHKRHRIHYHAPKRMVRSVQPQHMAPIKHMRTKQMHHHAPAHYMPRSHKTAYHTPYAKHG